MRFILMLLISVLVLWQCSSENKQTMTADNTKALPDQESWDATIIITREGQRVGYLQAGHIEKYSKKQLTVLSDSIMVDFYNKQGQHTSVLHALGGKVYDRNQDMLAFGNVVVDSDSGVTLYTDTLKWDNKRQKIVSEIPVMITTRDNDTLYGDDFISDPDLINYQISNPRGKTTRAIDVR
ncbi:MAG: LPS export ABC transporter periplasmic protein LptC [Caldithrix sp.]|nr:LPS export ABC transporter periplasmic protein LptC [Caldithrix sp.]